jgi:hypothetical protein
MQSDEAVTTELVPLNTIRVETALSRYPVHRLARRGSVDISIREGLRTGTETTWEVDYSKKHGQPGPLAYKLDTLVINRKIEEAIRPIPRVLKIGSLKDLCRQLGMAETGGNTNQIKKALYQNAFAGITTKTRYRGGDGSEQTLEAGFNRYSVIFTGEKLPDGRKADGVYIVLNDVFIQIINGAMTRPLDYEYLKSLPPAPQRFYELLSFQMYAAMKYDRPRARIAYSEFCAHAPQTRHTNWENVRSQMNKVHRPHRQSGYIAEVDFQQTIDKDGRPDWIIFYQPGPKARAEFRAFTKRGGPAVLEIEPPASAIFIDPDVSDLERVLVGCGVTSMAAKALIREHAEEKIRAQIERVEWLAEKKPDKVEDPAAYLVGAIKNDYAAPKGFVSKVERQRREEAKRQKEQQAAAERRARQEADARDKAEQLAVETYWKSLTAEQQAKLDEACLANADPESLAIEHGPMKRIGQTIRRNEHIRDLLRDRKTRG